MRIGSGTVASILLAAAAVLVLTACQPVAQMEAGSRPGPTPSVDPLTQAFIDQAIREQSSQTQASQAQGQHWACSQLSWSLVELMYDPGAKAATHRANRRAWERYGCPGDYIDT